MDSDARVADLDGDGDPTLKIKDLPCPDSTIKTKKLRSGPAALGNTGTFRLCVRDGSGRGKQRQGSSSTHSSSSPETGQPPGKEKCRYAYLCIHMQRERKRERERERERER